MFRPDVTVIGGGLAGCEAAWQLAERGVRVALVEMKPAQQSPAHTTPLLAELVCSNSLRSDEITAPAGLLKAELRACRSLIISCADEARVPAGEALAVDRRLFSQLCTVRVARHQYIRLERRRVDRLPDGPAILAGGPLLAGGAAREIQRLCGERLYFYDAIAPIVDADSIDWSCCFRASRHDRSGGDGAEGDYVNCPLTREEYYRLVDEIRGGRKVLPHRFEEPRYFEGCLPIEVMVERGVDTLAFGPLRPVGLTDPRNPSEPPFAVVQLRAENRHGTAYNLVGFQTRLAYPEQKRIFALIPALRHAEWLRFGSIHRNSYVEAWRVLDAELALRRRPSLHLAGQLTGVEGYIESTAMGLLAAWFVHGKLTGRPVPPPPETTALGGLYQHVVRPRQPGERYVPMNINFGLLPPLPGRIHKAERRALMARRAQQALQAWLAGLGAGWDQPASPPSLSAASTAAP